MQRKPRLLIIEDETAIRTGLVDVFLFHGYEVEFAVDGPDGLRKANSGRFDLILLDVMLPGLDGFAVCEAIRAQDRDQPIIMLTARNTDEDIVRGLALGADDYVAKPFSVAQLVLRVQAVLRRARIGIEETPQLLLADDVHIDTLNLSGHIRGTSIAFTRREMEILQYLHAHHERPVPREELLHRIWGYARDLDIETRTVDIHIAKLRRKLEVDVKNPKHLVTVRGGGYRLLTQQEKG
ncbi:MAG TPA: response regulator transcription factor [Dongiaceae bacterium]|nr:response regulator transcription factor [Dongiaceae bacterium]